MPEKAMPEAIPATSATEAAEPAAPSAGDGILASEPNQSPDQAPAGTVAAPVAGDGTKKDPIPRDDKNPAPEDAKPEAKDGENKDGENKDGENGGEIDYEKVDLGIEDPDPAIASQFASLSRDLKLSPEQMRGLAKWQETFAQKQRETMTREGAAMLSREYGPAFERMRADARALISRIDDATGGEFGRSLGRIGALCDPGVAKGFMLIAQAFSEDSLGARGEGAAPLKPETAYDGLAAAFGKK